jgi:sugar phosphate permease
MDIARRLIRDRDQVYGTPMRPDYEQSASVTSPSRLPHTPLKCPREVRLRLGADVGSVEQTASVLCIEIEVHKHMDDQSVAQRQSSSLGKSSFAPVTVLAVCFMLSVLGRGLVESFTVFLLPISETFGWNRGQIISIYSLASLAGALTSPLVGRMFDGFGPRVVYSLGLIVLGGAFLVAAYGQQLWQFQISLGLCVGLGLASIGTVPSSILLGRWFGPRLPTAMAFVYSGASAGVLMLLPVSQLLIDHIGWRGALSSL